jgi:hypothetical protein
VLPIWSVSPALAGGAVAPVRITRAGVFRPWLAATLAAAPPSPFAEFFVGLLAAQGRTLARTGTAR